MKLEQLSHDVIMMKMILTMIMTVFLSQILIFRAVRGMRRDFVVLVLRVICTLQKRVGYYNQI